MFVTMLIHTNMFVNIARSVIVFNAPPAHLSATRSRRRFETSWMHRQPTPFV